MNKFCLLQFLSDKTEIKKKNSKEKVVMVLLDNYIIMSNDGNKTIDTMSVLLPVKKQQQP